MRMRRKSNDNHSERDGRFTSGDGDADGKYPEGGDDAAGRVDAAVALSHEPGQRLVALNRLRDLRRDVSDGDPLASRIDGAIARIKERAGPKKSYGPPMEQKFIGVLIALGGVYLAALAAATVIDGAIWLTRELAGRIIDFLRGEEAVLLEQIADKERELAAAESRASEVTGVVSSIQEEVDKMRDRLRQIRDAVEEVEATPTRERKCTPVARPPGAHAIYR